MPSVSELPAHAKGIGIFCKLASVQSGLFVPPAYNYHAVRRLITVDEDETVEATEDDPLGELLVEAATQMAHRERQGSFEIDVEPLGGLAGLFDPDSKEAKALRPKLFLAFNLRESAAICGFLTCCDFTRDDTLSTTKFTRDYCRQHRLPALGSDWLLLDIVSSKQRGAGALVVLHAYTMAIRSKMKGCCAVVYTRSGRRLFESLGFELHDYRERGASRTFAHAAVGSLSIEQINKRVRWDGDKRILEDVCHRFGLTAKTSSKVMGRC